MCSCAGEVGCCGAEELARDGDEEGGSGHWGVDGLVKVGRRRFLLRC